MGHWFSPKLRLGLTPSSFLVLKPSDSDWIYTIGSLTLSIYILFILFLWRTVLILMLKQENYVKRLLWKKKTCYSETTFTSIVPTALELGAISPGMAA